MPITYNVSTAAQLATALAKAGSGDTILLAPGDYGNLLVKPDVNFGEGFTSPVTIAAANPDKPPVFTGLDLREVSNLTFEGVTFDYTYKAGQLISHNAFGISNSTNVTIRDSLFDGDMAQGLSAKADGYAAGLGLSVRGSDGITVEGTEFRDFFRGLAVNGSTDVLIRDNDIHSMRKDGINLSQVQRVTIENNHIHDFRAAPLANDHKDMIQFWTSGTTKPTTDVVIRGNTLDIGDGSSTQSIFMRNDQVDKGLAGTEMYYCRVTIENNVIVNAQSNAIAIGATAGLIIRNNSVLHADGGNDDGLDAPVEIPQISVAPESTGVTITRNATSDILGHTGQTGWIVKYNAFVQDQNPFAPGWYGDVFVASTLTTEGPHRFVALPGGILDILDAGASATLAPPQTGPLDAAFHAISPDAGGQTRLFDASVTAGEQPAGTTYLWSFGDGTTASGKTVSHTYAEGGTYDVTLTVRLPNGTTDRETLALGIEGRDLVHLDDTGAFVVYSKGEPIVLSGTTDTLTTAMADTTSDTTSGGLDLGGPGIAASVARSYLGTATAADDVTVALRLSADQTERGGEVVRLHGAFVLSVSGEGEAVLTAWSSTGQQVRLVADDVDLLDQASHDVEIRLENGRLELWVDGAMGADTAFAGTFANTSRNALMFGNPWNSRNFDGTLEEFEIAANDGEGSATDFDRDPFTAAFAVDAPLI